MTPELQFGFTIIPCRWLSKKVLRDPPTFRTYSRLRRYDWFRTLRAWYIRWTRRRVMRDESNWVTKPMRHMYFIDRSTIVMHPAMRNELVEALREKEMSSFAHHDSEDEGYTHESYRRDHEHVFRYL